MADIKTVQLIVNAEQAQNKLKEINKQLELTRQKKLDAFKVGDAKGIEAYSKEIKKLERQAAKMQSRSVTIANTLRSLDKATPNELKSTIREINKELSSGKVARGSKEWNALTEALRECNGELKKIKEESGTAGEALSEAERGIAGFGNKWVGIIGSIQMGWAVLDKVRGMMGEYVQSFTQMAEAESQVEKYTGMTRAEVEAFNEELKKMDTRTPREQLNALAGDAGRLGITGKEAVLDFVQAADMINVALGEDLGDDAVKNIGKLAQLFGDDERMGLKQAMLATGSTINQLGQTSSASEGYIVEFSGRLSSMANQAGMTQAQVMGLAAVLDQGMVNAEQGSTALSAIIQKLYKEPQKMASAVGLDVKNFTQLLKTDANAALLQFATAVGKMGGMEAVAPLLGDLKMAGAGVSKTLATLAGNIDLVRETQDEATEAFSQGTSILAEYEKANNTPMAQQEKLANKLNDLKVQLGKELYPVWQTGMGMTAQMVGLLSTLISFLGTYGKQILSVTALLGSYHITVALSSVATKAWAVVTGAAAAVQAAWNTVLALGRVAMIAYTYGLRGATLAARAFTAATMAHPLGFLATILTTVVGLFWSFGSAAKASAKEVNKLGEAQDHLKKIQEKAADSTAKERSQIEKLTGIIRGNAATYDEKKRAIDALRRIVPGYYAELSEEGRLIKENTAAISTYIEMLNAKAMAKAAEEYMTELSGKLMKAEMKLARKKGNVAAVKRELGKAGYQPDVQTIQLPSASAFMIGGVIEYDKNQSSRKQKEAELQFQKDAVNAAQAQVDALRAEQKQVETYIKNNPAVLKHYNMIEDPDPGGDVTKEAAQRIKDSIRMEKLGVELKRETGVISKKEYDAEMIRLEQQQAEQLMGLYAKNTSEWIDAKQAYYQAAQKADKNYAHWSIHEVDERCREEQRAVEKNYADGLISEKEYRRELTRIRIDGLRAKAATSSKWGQTDDAEKYTREADDLEMKDKLQRRQEFERKAQQMQQEYLKKSIAERKADELKMLDELVKAGVIAEEKKEEIAKGIRKKYDEEEKEEQDPSPVDVGGSMDPISGGVVALMNNLDALKEKIKEDKAEWEDYAAVAVSSLGMVSATLGAASNYMQACYQAEAAEVEARYDAEIKAVGANTKQGKKLEEKKQKELAALKSKANKKAMAIEVAQAVAGTAMGAINAYATAAKTSLILAPIAAATAVAAGALQIATIKKQHEAQAAGYYEGGFTGGSSYRQAAGVVHEGEFVANHHAVNNPNVLPVLKLLDYAQRHNTVAQVTSSDIVTAAGGGVGAAVMTPVVIHETQRTSEALERLNENLEAGTLANVVLEDFDRAYRRFQKLQQRSGTRG